MPDDLQATIEAMFGDEAEPRPIRIVLSVPSPPVGPCRVDSGPDDADLLRRDGGVAEGLACPDCGSLGADGCQCGGGGPYKESDDEGAGRPAGRPAVGGKAVGRETIRRDEAIRAAGRLADAVIGSQDGRLTPAMRADAAAVRNALGGGGSAESRPGRAFRKDLVVGGLYVGRGWVAGEFEWTYLGPVEGDPSRIRMSRAGKPPSVELVGDHGLAPYDGQGNFWHPTNWTEGTGVGEGTGRIVSEAAGRDVGMFEIHPEGDDGLP